MKTPVAEVCGQTLLGLGEELGVFCREHRAGVVGFVSRWFYFVCFHLLRVLRVTLRKQSLGR